MVLSITPRELLAYLWRMKMPPSSGEPPVFRDDRRVEALRAPRTGPSRRKVAALYPELRPPHVFLSEDENLALERLYWRGLGYREAARGDDYWSYWKSVAELKDLEQVALNELAYYSGYNDLAYYRITD